MTTELESLVRAATNGNTEAYGDLIDQTSSMVSSIALAIVRDLELSRDITQDVFLCAWRDLKALRDPGSFLPWLRQMTRNHAHTALRTLIRQRRLGASGILDDLAPVLADSNPTLTEQLTSWEEAKSLAEALSVLPETAREVLVLYYREEKSIAQVARLLDLSEVVVKKRLSRARGSLRAELMRKAGETLGRTVPGAAFTAAIISALPIAAPVIGSAASIAVSRVALKPFWVSKLFLWIVAPVAGAMAGVFGVLHESDRLLQGAYDEEEQRSLRTHRWVSVVLVLFYCVTFPVGWVWTHSRIFAIFWFVAFVLSLAILQFLWLGRILKTKRAAQMQLDPRGAAERADYERRRAVVGWTLGVVLGAFGLFLGLWFATR